MSWTSILKRERNYGRRKLHDRKWAQHVKSIFLEHPDKWFSASEIGDKLQDIIPRLAPNVREIARLLITAPYIIRERAHWKQSNKYQYKLKPEEEE